MLRLIDKDTKYFHGNKFYLSLLISSHSDHSNIGVYFCPFSHLIVLHLTFKILLAFSTDINFNIKPSQKSSVTSTHTAFDASYLYKITEEKNLSLM